MRRRRSNYPRRWSKTAKAFARGSAVTPGIGQFRDKNRTAVVETLPHVPDIEEPVGRFCLALAAYRSVRQRRGTDRGRNIPAIRTSRAGPMRLRSAARSLKTAAAGWRRRPNGFGRSYWRCRNRQADLGMRVPVGRLLLPDRQRRGAPVPHTCCRCGALAESGC